MKLLTTVMVLLFSAPFSWAANDVTQSPGGIVRTKKSFAMKTGSFAIAGSVFGAQTFEFDYNISSSWIMTPSIGFGDSHEHRADAGGAATGSSKSRSMGLAIYYAFPVGEDVFFGIGPSYSYATTTQDSAGSSTHFETKRGTIAANLRIMMFLKSRFGIFTNLSVESNTNKQSDTNPASESKSTELETATSELGFLYYFR